MDRAPSALRGWLLIAVEPCPLGRSDGFRFRSDQDVVSESAEDALRARLAGRLRRSGRWALQETASALLSGQRVGECGHKVVPGSAAAIVRGPSGSAHYAGVRSCGEVWVCPHCAAKVGRRRSLELRRAVEAARAQGLHVTLITFTVRHHWTHDLAALLDGLTSAMRRWRSGRVWQRHAKSMGYVGSVRNLEVTWGEGSGWHPHAHALLFTRERIGRDLFDELAVRWVASVDSCGGSASVEHGLALSDAEADIRGYLSKAERELAELEGREPKRGWGAAEELVYSHMKGGRREGRVNAWGLLQEAAEGSYPAALRFIEYAGAFRGRRQLVWSRGLRYLLTMGAEVGDEEAANAEGEVSEVVYVFTEAEWRAVVRGGHRGALLDVAEDEGEEGVVAFLAGVLACGGGGLVA